MKWIRQGNAVATDRSRGVFVHTFYSPDQTVMINSLVLENLSVGSSGIWKCQVTTNRGNVTRAVNIVVISDDSVYCPVKVTKTNKGTFIWPKTVSGITIDLPCEKGRSVTYQGRALPQAFYRCNKWGQWEELDTGQCQYVNEVTRVLEQAALVSYSLLFYFPLRSEFLNKNIWHNNG